MPTPFDDFTEKAHRNCMDLPAEAIEDRQLLERVMEKHHFRGLNTEWWQLRFARLEEIPNHGRGLRGHKIDPPIRCNLPLAL